LKELASKEDISDEVDVIKEQVNYEMSDSINKHNETNSNCDSGTCNSGAG
jgi:hypothetical protein